MTFAHIFSKHSRIIFFGMLMALCSNIGQTYFISLFNPSLREALHLSQGSLGALYSAATLLSGVFFIFFGEKVDSLALRKSSVALCLLGGFACFSMACVANPATLFVSLFLLRLIGAGLFSHIALTAVAKECVVGRGKALSLTSFGFPLGEAVFPIIVVFTMHLLGWKVTWWLVGSCLLCFTMPTVMWLLSYKEKEIGLQVLQHETETDKASWNRKQVLKDYRFYCLMPAIMAPAVIVTGMFFYQSSLAYEMNWSLALLAKGFLGYSICHIIGTLISGISVDKYGSYCHVSFTLGLFLAALMLLQLELGTWVIYCYLSLVGLGVGFNRTLATSLWVELYGSTHLGQVRAMVSSIIVISAALIPMILGYFLDRHVTMLHISQWLCYFLCLVMLLSWVPLYKSRAFAVFGRNSIASRI